MSIHDHRGSHCTRHHSQADSCPGCECLRLCAIVKSLTAEVKKEQDYAAHWKNAVDIAAKGIEGLKEQLIAVTAERDALKRIETNALNNERAAFQKENLMRGERDREIDRFQNVLVNIHNILTGKDCDPRVSIGLTTSAARRTQGKLAAADEVAEAARELRLVAQKAEGDLQCANILHPDEVANDPAALMRPLNLNKAHHRVKDTLDALDALKVTNG